MGWHSKGMCVCSVAQSYPTLLWFTWTVNCHVPVSMGFPRQEYWSRLPFPSPGNLPNPGIEPTSLALVGIFFTVAPLGSPSLKGRQLIFSWTQGQEVSWAARKYWNQNLESHPDSLPVSHVTIFLWTVTQSPLCLFTSHFWSLEWNLWLLKSPEDTQYHPTVLLWVLIPNCKGCSFGLPSLGQLSNLLEIGYVAGDQGYIQPNGPGAIFSKSGNPVKRVIMSWADTPKQNVSPICTRLRT